MKIGLSSAAFYGRGETEDQAERAAQFPVDCCEVFLQTSSEYSAAFGRLVRSRLGDTPCVSVHPKGLQFENDMFGLSARQVNDSLSMFSQVCDAGAALGARYYVLHGPAAVTGPRPPRSIYALQDVFGRMQQIAAKRGMEILWENVFWCSLRTPEDVQTMRSLLPELRFVLDVKQAWRAGADPIQMIQAMGDRLAHVHVLDQRPDGTLCLPGQGIVDWQGIADALRRVRYTGAVILEPYEAQARDAAALEKSILWLKRVFAGGES